MRWLFFALLAANVGLGGWNWQQGRQQLSLPVEQASAPEAMTVSKAARLVLLSERDSPGSTEENNREVDTPVAAVSQDPVPDVAHESTVSPQAVAQTEPRILAAQCLRLGALDSKELAAQINKALRQGNSGAKVLAQGEESTTITRYRVMLPPYATATAASNALERLRRAGIKDVYLIRSGENQNAISLGVFSTKESAQRRARQIAELKLVPRIDEITMPVTQWWIEFDWPAGQGNENWRALLPKELRGLAPDECR